MATFKTDTALAQAPAGSADWKRAAGVKVSGEVMVAVSTYTLAGTETANDFIEIVSAPAGTRVVPHLSKVVCEVPGTLSGTIGDAGKADRYSTALTLTAGGNFDYAGAATGSLVPWVNESATAVLFDITAATSLVAGRKLVFYTALSAQV